MVTMDLDKCPIILPYLALSYVWGTPEPKREIIVNGIWLLVRPNLYQAMEALCNGKWLDEGKFAYWWIDALCINQEHNEEKAHQVALMSGIYSMAWYILLWLSHCGGVGRKSRCSNAKAHGNSMAMLSARIIVSSERHGCISIRRLCVLSRR